MMPFWWACCIAWQTGMNSSSRSAESQLVRHRSSWVIGTPLTSSMTKKGRPESGCPPSSTLAIFGMIHQGQGLPLGLEPGQDLHSSPCRALMSFSATRRA